MIERKSCRVCLCSDLADVLYLGELPLANRLLSDPDETEARHPLSLRRCAQCGLVQLGHVIPAEELYTSEYPFQTGSSRRMVEHFSQLYREHLARVPTNGLAVEIGCNDCAAWEFIERPDVQLKGVDPAATQAPKRGLTHRAPFGSFLKHYFPERAHLIVACNVLAHVDDLQDFVGMLKWLLRDDGAFVFEVPYLPAMLQSGSVDQIYHEHLSYFALRPLAALLRRHWLRMEAIEFFDVHGGSVRVTATHGEGESDQVRRTLAAEGDLRAPVADFVRRATEDRYQIRETLEQMKNNGEKVIGYCASAKGAVTLNWCGIGTDLLPLVIDSTPTKLGKYMPGTHQQIIHPNQCSSLYNGDVGGRDAVLLLSPNHAAEIMAKHPKFRGQWILPRTTATATEGVAA